MNPAKEIIRAFGGLRAAQRALGEKHINLLQNWQKTGRIPHYREGQIRGAAERLNVQLPQKVMRSAFPPEARPGGAA